MRPTDLSERKTAQRVSARFVPTAIAGAAGVVVLIAGGSPAVGWSLLVFAGSLLAFALQQPLEKDARAVAGHGMSENGHSADRVRAGHPGAVRSFTK
jgi:hypothetical protein